MRTNVPHARVATTVPATCKVDTSVLVVWQRLAAMRVYHHAWLYTDRHLTAAQHVPATGFACARGRSLHACATYAHVSPRTGGSHPHQPNLVLLA